MIINSNYIYILFTSFTMVLINILFVCKYCKCSQNTNKHLIFSLNSTKTGKIYIYMDVLFNTLIHSSIQIFIYHIYNIYRLVYTQKLIKNLISKNLFRKQTKVQ